jgi:diaminohydroxyphosphoribosylaminopyrimidine deaminase/5-amino-6-(5-phosphoribosylamino)uracil reductase
MILALRLAAKGRWTASPNPMVGAVVVKHGKIVGRGFHLRPGLPHAEVLALRQAGTRARGATLYVTLEPCCHVGKRTPPCVPAVIDSGVRRVVIATNDPNPVVSGNGVKALRRAGLSITMGVAAGEAERLNRAYVHSVTKRRPYVTLKAGMTLDGKIAASSGDARWITSLASRREVHRLRAEFDAVMVGIGTVIADDPALTARTGARLATLAARQPVRIVLDSRLRVPRNARILARQDRAKTWIATTETAPRSRRQWLARKGVDVLVLPQSKGRVLLPALLKELGRRGIRSLLVEGGSELNAALLRSRLVDHVRLYIAPSLLGGRDAKGLIGGKSPTRVAGSLKLRNITVRSVGGDVVVAGDV